MAEKSAARRLMLVLKEAGLDPVRIENRVGPGTPDINYLHGWIEVKQLPGFPKREGTLVRVPHYTDAQRNWHRRAVRAGRLVWVVLRVGREWFLFDGLFAAQRLGSMNKEEMIEYADGYWPNHLNQEEFLECLL